MSRVSPPAGEAPEVLAQESGRGWCRETWRFAGSRGDRVLAEVWSGERRPGPVVVAGHGAGSDRHAPHPAATGKGWARAGVCVVGADAPGHGDRAGGASSVPPEGTALLADPGFLEWWVADHRRVVDVVEARFGTVPVGYVGVSMGGVFGVHLLAAEPRIRSAVLAVTGRVGGSPGTDPAAVAARIDRPVLMLQADADEVFSRDDAFGLYDALGTGHKEICFLPGTHAVWRRPAHWNRRMLAFVAETLG